MNTQNTNVSVLLALLSFLFQVAAAAPGFSQDSLQTQTLQEVVIYGMPSREFITGSRQQYFDSIDVLFPASTLSDLLHTLTPVYIKEYGSYMLSTISLRGTGAGHTSTLWNGLNINSSTLGITDFSQIPAFAGDRLVLHYGGASALYGSESIGGSIIIQSEGLWTDTPLLTVYQDAGSFQTYRSRVSLRIGNSRVESSTRAYHTYSKNNFPFNNILKPGSPVERQQHTSVRQTGLLQDVYWKTGARSQFSVNTWYHHSNRQIQPTMGNTASADIQEDENLRLAVSFQNSGDWGRINAKAGYLYDFMLFNNVFNTTSNQWILQSAWSRKLTPMLKSTLGVSWKNVAVETNNYAGNVAENRWDVYLWIKYTPFRIWELALNIRQAGVPGFRIPAAPTLGSTLDLMKNNSHHFQWRLMASGNYRIPTLNDRYWNPGGNPDLQPEQSWSAESGFLWQYAHSPETTFTSDITWYNMWVDNWIIWLPQGSYWSPQNIREVRSSGLELALSGIHHVANGTIDWNISYAFTRSVNKTSLDEYDRSAGKQLPFVPLHNVSMLVYYNLFNWKFSFSENYTGDRFITTDNEDVVDGYWLTDMKISRQVKWTKESLLVSFEIKNLLNKTYYNLPLRAMPGRNFRLGLMYNLNY